MYLENNTINKFKRNDTLGNVIYMPDKRLISRIPKYLLQIDDKQHSRKMNKGYEVQFQMVIKQ